ncbi:MAG: 4'-phosphopantetheinyl transferase superfamily protein [Flavobacteriales bacterium]|nr:4'-phosphopantetheinyl transferase superfamily protein [Flavobacteriales bacterium]MCC6937272.1 4'-phosphopantetheinyl transferase superfamily protein [Flavobacteriales bacterium]
MKLVLARPLTVHCHDPEPAVWSATAIGAGPPPADTVDVWYATLDQMRPLLSAYTELLDPVEIERADRFRFEPDRERFILGHGLLRMVLMGYVGGDGRSIRYARGPFGKPSLDPKEVHFNFSDTKDAFLIGVSRSIDLGVDIETMTRNVDHEAVSEHYFTGPEITAIRNAGGHSKRRFLEFWTRKEAVLKASGVGIMDDLRVLRVDAPTNTMTIDHESFTQMAAPEYRVRTWHIGADHIVSIALPSDLKAFRMMRIDSALTPPPRSGRGS